MHRNKKENWNSSGKGNSINCYTQDLNSLIKLDYFFSFIGTMSVRPVEFGGTQREVILSNTR